MTNTSAATRTDSLGTRARGWRMTVALSKRVSPERPNARGPLSLSVTLLAVLVACALPLLLAPASLLAAGDVTCPTGKTACDGRCVNVEVNAKNCGGCGHACEPGQTCTSGMCMGTASCAAGKIMCGDVCVNLTKNRKHCGNCETACEPGQTCEAGMCSGKVGCQAGKVMCGNGCFNLAKNAKNCGACGHACAAGATCISGVCSG